MDPAAPVLLPAAVIGTAALWFLLRLILRAADAVPVAHAWNPNTHDRMSSYALSIVRDEESTLLGWVAKQGMSGGTFFYEHACQQLRRGSVDEDMSSDIWRSYLASLLVHETEQAIKDQSYEGTNGVYHFYTPPTGTGLNDVSENLKEILWVLRREFRSTSAVTRATAEMSAEEAFLDKERRNYTHADSARYFTLGYTHLSWYALGRVLHLLQDMAVPAHIRNDGHANRKDEHPEPLEYFADYTDSLPFGVGTAHERWSYHPERDYAAHRDAHYGKAKEALSFVDTSVVTGRQDLSLLMHQLAAEIYPSWYSFGTIPGNADSHNPVNPAEHPWYSDAAPDPGRCIPNPAALRDVLNLLTGEANECSRFIARGSPPPREGFTRNIPLLPEDPDGGAVADCLADLEERLPGILAFRPDFDRFRSTVLEGNPLSLFEKFRAEYEAIRPVIADFGERMGILRDARLREHLAPGAPAYPAFDRLIASYPDRRRLTDLFRKPPRDELIYPPHDNPGRDWHRGFHGPYCLVTNSDEVKPQQGPEPAFLQEGNIIARQYDAVGPRAIAYSALLLNAWFEHQYRRTGRGLGLWINRNAPDAETPPEPGPQDRSADCTIQNQKPEAAGILPEVPGVFTLGMVNHLPVEIGVDLSLSVVEIPEADRVEFPDGIPLRTITRCDSGQGMTGEVTRLQVPQRLPAGVVVQAGRIERVPPYNFAVVQSISLPVDDPGLEAIRMGGIRREKEGENLHPVTDNPGKPVLGVPGDPGGETDTASVRAEVFRKKGMDKPASVILRFEFGYESGRPAPGERGP